jgi:hypothetical protein
MDREIGRPRTLTYELSIGEIERLANSLAARWQRESEEEISEIREGLKGTVLRGFLCDSPGYCGPVFFFLLGGTRNPRFLLIQDENGNFEIVDREEVI